jgi:mono/diheme cytochrome c family protein
LIRSSVREIQRRAARAPLAVRGGLALLLRAAALCRAAEPAAVPPGAAGGAGAAGAEVFANRCAVCHGPQAGGIPGSFPSLREQVVGFAKSPEGRDYLVMVVTTGLMGSLTVAGVNYNGVMPAQSGLSEAEVAAVLSYLSGSPIAAGDVTDARSRHPDKSAQATRALRPTSDL